MQPKLITDPTIRTHVLEQMAGHLGCEVSDIERHPLIGDGEGHFAFLNDEGEAILLDTSECHLYRTRPGTAQQWFMGDLITEAD